MQWTALIGSESNLSERKKKGREEQQEHAQDRRGAGTVSAGPPSSSPLTLRCPPGDRTLVERTHAALRHPRGPVVADPEPKPKRPKRDHTMASRSSINNDDIITPLIDEEEGASDEVGTIPPPPLPLPPPPPPHMHAQAAAARTLSPPV